MENRPQISKKSDDDKYYGENYKAEKEYSKCLAGAVGSKQWCAVFCGVTRQGLTDGNKLASEQKIEVCEGAYQVGDWDRHTFYQREQRVQRPWYMVYFIYKSYQLQMEMEWAP